MKKLYKIRLAFAIIVLFLTVLAFSGLFYFVRFLDFQFVPLVQRCLFDFSVAALIGLIILFLITVLFGRVYCSTFCPFGILQELGALIFKKTGRKIIAPQKNFGFKYLAAALTFGSLIGGSALLIRYIDPYSVFGASVSATVFGVIFAFVVLAIVFFKNSFFCTNICPVGALLGLCSKFSVNKIYMDKDACVSCSMCAKNCPSGSINYKEKLVENETCVKCLKCLSVCPKGAIRYGGKCGGKWGKCGGKSDKSSTRKFSPKRRELLWLVSSLALCSAAYAAGVNFSKDIAKKLKNIIFPAGAKDACRMANKCLNCNLCIKNCPNGILVKADENCSTVHIDYEKGKGYCEFNCNKCSEVCPSGAIEKISLEEKQNTRIAMASVNSECIKCSHCVKACPVGAIKIENGQIAVVDGSRCIGCGRCKQACPVSAIEIFAVNKQSQI